MTGWAACCAPGTATWPTPTCRGGSPGCSRDAGFSVTRQAVIPLLNVGYDPDTYSAGLIGFISAFVPRHSDITARARSRPGPSDLAGLGPGYFFSLNRYLFLAVRN